jgi:hypothetical protein
VTITGTKSALRERLRERQGAGYTDFSIHIRHGYPAMLGRVDPHADVPGSKCLSEVGIRGAASANAVYNACGTRVRNYPTTLDKVLPVPLRGSSGHGAEAHIRRPSPELICRPPKVDGGGGS